MGLPGSECHQGLRSGVHHSAEEGPAGPQAEGRFEGCQGSVPGDGRRPRGGGHQLASLRGAQPEGSGPSPGFSRNHRRGNPRRADASTVDRPGAGSRPGGAADRRSAVWIRRFAFAVAEDPAAALGRTGAKRGGATDRRTRAAADGLPRGRLLGSGRHVRHDPEYRRPGVPGARRRRNVRGRARICRWPADSGRPRFRPGHRPVEGPGLPAT